MNKQSQKSEQTGPRSGHKCRYRQHLNLDLLSQGCAELPRAASHRDKHPAADRKPMVGEQNEQWERTLGLTVGVLPG